MPLSASLVVSLTAASIAAADAVELDSVSVHLFLEDSGTFSRDISTVENFASWNWSSDEGKADAILIKIRFRSDGAALALGTQARVVVTTRKMQTSWSAGKVIINERLKDISVGPSGTTYRAIFVPGIGCKPLKITVTGSGKTITSSLYFACGE